MDSKKYLKIAGLSITGFALVFIGLYMIAFLKSGPTGFGLMMGGLLFSTIGGIYGKKKLMEGGEGYQSAVDSRQIDQIKQNVVSQIKPSKEADPPAQPPTQPEKPMPRQALKQELRPAPMIEEPEMAVQAPAADAVSSKPFKIMVCPSCDTENPPTNMYCSKCGKRLRTHPFVEDPEKAKKVKRAKAKR